MVVIEDDYEYKPFAGFQCYKVDPISLFSSYMLYEAVSLLPSDKLVEKIVKHDSWPIQPHIFSPPLLWLTSRKPLWLDLQTADIKSQWRHNWKSAQVVNCHLVCDPTIQQPGFRPPSATVVSAEPFLHGTGTLQCLQKEMATYRLICVLVARPRRCPTLSNPVPWQNWMAPCLGYTLRMKMLFHGWPVMVHDTHTGRRRLLPMVMVVEAWVGHLVHSISMYICSHVTEKTA